MKKVEISIKALIGIAIIALLYLSYLFNYLLFHSLAEIFSICIAVTVFLITWNSTRILQNNYLLLIGYAYLFIGFLDLFHALSYQGMAIFVDYDYHANQLWVVARYFESIILLFSFFFLNSKRKINAAIPLVIYTTITVASMLSIFVWHNFPVAYVAGVGQTPFKIISEYIIIAILLASIIILRTYRKSFELKVYRFLLWSFIFTALSEFCFSSYVSNYGIPNMLGHYFKIVSFFFIYLSIVRTGIQEPYNLIFKEMKQTEQQLYEQNQLLSSETVAKDLTIKEHIALLNRQYEILNRQAKLLDLSNEPIFVWALHGTIIYWNKGAELTYGYTSGEAIGQISHELLKTQRLIPINELEDALIRDGVWTGEITHTTKDGRKLIIETIHQIYDDINGKKIVLEISRDITDRRAMEFEIGYRSNLLNSVIEEMHDALFVYDSTGEIVSVNAQARRMYPDIVDDNTTAENIFENFSCYDLAHHPIAFDDYPTRRALRGEKIRNEKLILERNNHSVIAEINAKPLLNERGQIIATVVFHHDITELIKKQQEIEEHVIELQQQNKKLNRQARLLDLSYEAIFVWYLDGPVIYWNQGAKRLYGYMDDEAIGCIPTKLLNSRFPFSYEELKTELNKNGAWSGYVEHTTKDGRQLIMETRMQVIVNETGMNTVLETNRDVTDRINAENAIKKITYELKNIINSTNDFIWSVDTDYRIIFCNKAVYDFTKEHYGFEMEPGLFFLDLIPKENASSYREFFEYVKREGELKVDISSFRGEKYISYTFHPVYVEGRLVEITVFGRDVTERLKAEQEIIKLNASLEGRISERTKELEQSLKTIKIFTMTMTHDLKVPLQQICILSDHVKNNIDVEKNLNKIGKLCSSTSTMITELIDYERLSTAEIRKQAVDLKAITVSVFEELKTDCSVLDFETGIPVVMADEVLIKRVMANLVSNAIKFSANKVTPKIIFGCRKEKNEFVFYLKDNGIGFDMKYAEKLFCVFERLHGAGEFEGNGLGLASVRNIIAKHGGRTWIEGKVNGGAIVFFTLPVESDEETECTV